MHSNRRRSGTVIALMAALIALVSAALAGCSSATPASSTSGSASAPIRVGVICSCSGAESSALGLSGTVAQAWAKSVNAAGGINGTPVQLYVKDDGLNPATSLQDAKELVQQDKVVAITDMSAVDAAWANYVASAGVPVVGGEPVFPPFATNPDFFPVGGSLSVEIYSSFQVGKQDGATKLGFLYCAESPVCANLEKPASAYANSLGLGFTAAKVSATAPNYIATCLQLKDSGVNALSILDTAPTVQRILSDCAQQGYKPLVVSNTGASSTQWLTDPDFANASVTSVNANYTNESIPGVKAFVSAMHQYAPGVLTSNEFSYPMVWTWAAGELFQAAGNAAKLTGSSTPADVKQGLYALRGATLGGLSAPLTFTPGKPAFVPCYFNIKIEGQKFVSSGGATCLSSAAAGTIKAAGVF